MDAHSLTGNKLNLSLPEFRSGDTVKVNIKVKEGERERTQLFEGVVIRRSGSGSGASFAVRRVSLEVGVERTFLLNSPAVHSVEVVRRGGVRRSRVNYLRGRSGRKARIKEKMNLK